MSWTNRMARHGSERSLQSLSLTSARNSGQSSAPGVPDPPGGTSVVVKSPSTPANAAVSSTPLQTPSPTSGENSRIPRPSPAPLRRAGSLRVRGERALAHQHHRTPVGSAVHHLQGNTRHPQEFFPAITENGVSSPRHRSLSLSLTPVRPRNSNAAASLGADDSDADSLKSYGSACSTASACDHALFALNGTTWSGKSRKYVVHCSNHNGDTERYLTPTQRAARQIRKLQTLLSDAKKEIEEKDQEIFRLAKEVVELRLYKASLNSPDDRTDSSDALTVRENNLLSPESPCKDLPDEGCLKSPTNPESPEKINSSDLPSSLADSGHFEDSSVHSKDSASFPPTSTNFSNSRQNNERDEERRRIVNLYESRIEEMHRTHIDELQTLKQKHNDKVESLLTQLSEINIRYCEVRPSMDAAETRTRELETELEAVKKELGEQKALLDEQEERNKQMYLKMYAKGQEAARIEHADQILEQAHQTPSKVSVPELLQQLTITKAELENIKDTSYTPEPHISADSSKTLLSAKEAVSLWVLGVRKAMYRRIIESRSSQGALDPEITLQFLKSAVYYFLTDRENHNGHLNAIESILGFTEAEKHNIDKLYRSLRK
ncbi:protein quick-to-court isoform X1 [Neodiprion pinetum]|uniref:protein quick-to-court isoform X1 n=1 Tax=Neodiprion pinetum TaxID=441929 RepID=UPI001EDD93BF|nr:protein quick-to-court isoform X1 [Neodiprion pinetum]